MVDVALVMHINHRRKNKFRCKHHGARSYRTWMQLYSNKDLQRGSWQRRRAQASHLMAHGCYDLLESRYREDILWHYW